MNAVPTATITLRDIDVRYREAGSGPAVVLVHGLAEDHLSWHVQQETLAGFRTYAYDLRGHGGTTQGVGQGTLAQLRDDLGAFLREVSGPAYCVGFSLGGTVVLAAAAAEPDLVTGAVLIGTSTVVGRAAAEFYAERIGRVTDQDSSALAEALHADTAAALVNPASDVDAITQRRIVAVGDGGGYANAARAMAGLRSAPLTPELGSVRCPVSVIGAEHDTFCPRKAADIIREALPHATYTEIADAGHLMNVEQPEAVTASITTALEGMS
ncbi:pimeloyl-ACP methyl ester carboxylesterase [Tamaricihabitans halophyticus]|uniref:Pimeloyl-ACP methyl ester carboxylesterase n=1 Tax=Tamaricihabitans halophyticus TaxID=1262583 RepID=A0A4R2QHN7_9PSEU|nr:alpha/beta hydrolase [Tamaricihabitans halophyticus]TCP47878.1 pimeloyl-ACP methyl ester carboxylesterase [Tamaricihabitans halophyticus]